MTDGQRGSETGGVWGSISYEPVMTSPLPDRLLPLLSPGARVLEVGCGIGVASQWLATNGVSVLGLDVNVGAIDEARAAAARRNLANRCTFRAADFLTEGREEFDAVMAIRVLTCFSDETEWNALAVGLRSSVKPGGLLFIWDFLRDDSSLEYAPRYARGLSLGRRLGAFHVPSSVAESRTEPQVQFVAYHHSDTDVEALASGWRVIEHERFLSRSMRGHEVLAFVLIIQRPVEPAMYL